VGDDLEPLINDEIEKAKIDLNSEGEILKNILLKIALKQIDQPTKQIGILQYETWFKETKTMADDPELFKLVEVLAFKQAYVDEFVPPATRSKDIYVLYKSINAEIYRLKALTNLHWIQIKL
jgi:hypothetical protein